VGECPLTDLQLHVVRLLAEGLSYEQIAQRRRRSVSTVRSQMHAVYDKLGVADRGQAVICCFKEGWLGIEPTESLASQMRRIADATEQLVTLVRQRSKLTEWQRAYMSAFDELLYADSEKNKAAARASMEAALGPVLAEAGIMGRPSRRKRELADFLASFVNATRAA
jgi:DNA-binding CsgD family transcriptional regulator